MMNRNVVKKSSPAKNSPSDDKITVRSSKGKVYLYYKLGNAWYSVELLSEKKKNSTQVGSTFTKRNKPFIKTSVYSESQIVLPESNLDMSIKSIESQGDRSIYKNNEIYEADSNIYSSIKEGTLFSFGKTDNNIYKDNFNESTNYMRVLDNYTETSGTNSSYIHSLIDSFYLDSQSAGVTITNASSLHLGVPIAGDNSTITNAYSLELQGNIKSNGLIIDDAGDITLDAAGADINFDVGGTNRLNWNGVTGLTMKSLVDLDDYFNISTTLEHGVTIFATHDDSGANGGHMQFQPQGDIKLQAVTGKVSLDATDKLYFDGGNDTYIQENAADNLKFVVGNDAIMTLVENASSGNLVNIGTSCAGFNQHEPTYNASDTNVLFMTSGNKAFLTFNGGDITDLNLYFPNTSCNCLLVIKQDGTGGREVTYWKTFDQDTGNESTVAWPGGEAPTLSTGANEVDIISFYWDNDNHKAYGVASLNFSSP